MAIIRTYEWEKYTAKLYGERSMVIYKNGREILHTGFRNCNTEEEVMKVLQGMPEWEEMMESRR